MPTLPLAAETDVNVDALNRKELQNLAKLHGIAANGKSVDIRDALRAALSLCA